MFNNICKFISIILIFITLAVLWNKTNEYSMEGEVVMVSQGHWVTIETEDGNRWEIDDYHFAEGNKVKVTLNNHDTPKNKKDDKVVEVIILN